MKLWVNGRPLVFVELDRDASLDKLVALLALKPDRIAIEHNGEIAARSTWSAVRLSEDDKLEIVQFVGGGR